MTKYISGLFLALLIAVSSSSVSADTPTYCTVASNDQVTCTWTDQTHTGNWIVQQGEIETDATGNSYTFDGSQYRDCGTGCSYGIDLIWRDGGTSYSGAQHYVQRLAGNTGGGENPLVFSAATSNKILPDGAAGEIASSISNTIGENMLPILAILAFLTGVFLVKKKLTSTLTTVGK
jgi:hypothetical protein